MTRRPVPTRCADCGAQVGGTAPGWVPLLSGECLCVRCYYRRWQR